MTEVTRIWSGTKVVQRADGKWEPVADDDPRAADAMFTVVESITSVDGRVVEVESPFPPTSAYTSKSAVAKYLLDTGASADLLYDYRIIDLMR